MDARRAAPTAFVELRGARRRPHRPRRGRTAVDFDLDHVVLALADPDAAAAELAQLGFERRNGALAVADRDRAARAAAAADDGERPLLNHLALLVDDAPTRVQDEARAARARDRRRARTPPTPSRSSCAGPDGIRIEYVEHKPGFALV